MATITREPRESDQQIHPADQSPQVKPKSEQKRRARRSAALGMVVGLTVGALGGVAGTLGTQAVRDGGSSPETHQDLNTRLTIREDETADGIVQTLRDAGLINTDTMPEEQRNALSGSYEAPAGVDSPHTQPGGTFDLGELGIDTPEALDAALDVLRPSQQAVDAVE